MKSSFFLYTIAMCIRGALWLEYKVMPCVWLFEIDRLVQQQQAAEVQYMHGNIIFIVNCTTICRVFYISLSTLLLTFIDSIPCMLILCVHISMIINLRATCIACTVDQADEDISCCSIEHTIFIKILF